MSVDRIKGEIAFLCDAARCHESLETGENDFADANRYRIDQGWAARNVDGEWKHFCLACRGART